MGSTRCKRNILLTVCWIGITMILAYVAMNPVFKMYEDGYINLGQLNENLIINDYHSQRQYMIINSILFLVFSELIFQGNHYETILRYGKRSLYWKNRMKKIFVWAFVYSVIYEITGFVFGAIYGNLEILVSHGFLEGILFQAIASCILYMQVYMMFQCLSSKTVDFIAIILVIAIMMGIYLIGKMLRGVYAYGEDITLLQNLCSGNYHVFECFLSVLRLLIIYGVLYEVLMKIKNKEDYIRDVCKKEL